MALTPLEIWAAFAGCLLLILYSGTRLSRYGEMIAVRTGLGGTWIGLGLVAAVTSLPELITGLSSVTVVGAPDLAVGDALGSCVVNLLILVVLDFAHRGESIYTRMRAGHSLSAAFGVIFLGVAAGSLMLQRSFSLRIGHVGVYTLIAIPLYALAIRSVFHYERRETPPHIEVMEEAVKARGIPPGLSLRQIYGRYAANALVIVGAGAALPAIGKALAAMMGWEHTFVGTTFLALATSVPEIVISVEAVRIGAVDLAIGNLLGSNLFDLLILGLDDLAYLEGPLFAAASPQHLFTTITALTMTGIVAAGLSYRPRARLFRFVGWVSFGLLTLGLVNALVLFLLRSLR